MAKTVHQLTIARRFFDRIEVRPLDVLDNRNFENFDIGEFADNDRKFMQLRHLRRAPSAFTRDNFERPIITAAYDQRLDNPFFANRVCKIIQILRIKPLARLLRIGRNLFNRNILFRRAF